MKNKIIIYTDGGSRGNPGPAGVGVYMVSEDGHKTKEYAKAIGVKTNNEAEYEAVILALQKVKQLYGGEKAKKMQIEMRMDSQLIARQLRGEYKMENEKLALLFIKVWNLRIELGMSNITFVEIPREQNKEADRLANEAMDQKKTESLF